MGETLTDQMVGEAGTTRWRLSSISNAFKAGRKAICSSLGETPAKERGGRELRRNTTGSRGSPIMRGDGKVVAGQVDKSAANSETTYYRACP